MTDRRKIGTMKEGPLVLAKMDKGPFAGEFAPTVFFEDAECDPFYVQFGPEGYASIIPGEYKWIMIAPELLEAIAGISEDACDMWVMYSDD